MQKLNPRTPVQAVEWARTLVGTGPTGLSGLCDHFVALAYGWGHSGDAYALRTWDHAEQRYTGVGRTRPAEGALMVWTKRGPGRNMGHIALSSGNGWVISTDVPGHDLVDEVPLAWFRKHWPSYEYLGWIQPQFLHPAAPISKPRHLGLVKPPIVKVAKK